MKPQPRYQPGDKIGGRYQVHQVKMGGMGEVYLCLDLDLNIPLALKTFQTRYLTNPRVREYFKEEVATWVALEKHPNIVRCFFLETVDNQPFMFLEWIANNESRGPDLRSWLWRGPLDLRLALDFTIDICRGLIHAQEKQPGVVHCDLKPDNILIAEGRVAKITDFGLAKIVQAAGLVITDAGAGLDGRQSLLGQEGIVGTPPYIAPEQWRGETLDARTDIYAVGCILYEILTGSWPFQATTLDGLRRQHLEADIPKLADSRIGALNELLAGCLAKAREERFATVGDLLQEISLFYQQQFTEPRRELPLGDEFTIIDYVVRSNTYYELGRYDEALADSNRAIELDPGYAPAYINRGRTYRQLQRIDDALADYSQATSLDPNLAEVYYNRSNIHENLGQYEEALADLDRAIELDPTLARAYTNRGLLYRKLQRINDALADYSRAIELEPRFALTYNNRGNIYADLQRYHEALADFNRAIMLDPIFAEAYNNRGRTYAQMKRHEAALADYNQAIELNQTFAPAYNFRGKTYVLLQQYEQALIDFNRAIELDPAFAEAYLDRANTYMILEQYEEALANCNTVIAIDPNFSRAYIQRGFFKDIFRRYDEALADYTHALELEPGYGLAYYNRGLTYGKLGRYDEALSDFDRAIQLNHITVEIYNERGKIYSRLERFEEALEALEHSLQLDPNDAATHFLLGVAQDQMDQVEEALTHYTRAIELDPYHLNAYNNRATKYYQLERYAEAQADLDRAIELDPDDAEVCFNKGVLLAATGRESEALSYLHKALELGHGRAAATIAFIESQISAELQTNNAEAYQQSIELNNQGYLMLQQGQIDQALELFQRSWELCQDIADVDGEIMALENIYLALRAAQRYAEALEAFGVVFEKLLSTRSFEKFQQYMDEVIQAVNILNDLGDVCIVRHSHYEEDLRCCLAKYGSHTKVLEIGDSEDVLEVMAHIPTEERVVFANTILKRYNELLATN